MKYLANIVTLSRVFVAIFFYFALVYLRITNFPILITCFILIEISDIADGFIARHSNAVSDLGKLLDPICDVTSHFLCLFALQVLHFVPPLVVVIFILREIWMQLLRTELVKRNLVLAANWAGKVKTWLYGIAIFFALIIFPTAPLGDYALQFKPMVTLFFYVAAISSVLSFLLYLKGAISVLRSDNR